jgi:RHS repeat-associated protein
VTAPREQGTGTATMSYEYGGLDATLNPAGAHAWATTRIHDVFNSGNLINTATFVDGMGRVVQRKRDAQVEGVAGEARIVEGAVEFDALGRAVKEWYPVVEQVPADPLTKYNTATSESGEAIARVPVTLPIVRSYDVFDRMRTQTLPDLSLETVRYEFAVLPQYDGGITMAKVTTTDPLGRAISQWLDVGGAVFRNEDVAAAASAAGGDPLAVLPSGDTLVDQRITASITTGPKITTRYDYDRLGRLVTVIDAAEAQTAHTYDFQDNVTSTDTPDGGLVQRTFAPSGQLLTVARAVGTVATYGYDRNRLIEVSYSDDTPDVAYEWGDDGEADNGAGRVIRTVDGAMERTYGYDGAGNVNRETATEDDAPFGIVIDDPKTWTTEWLYDSLGRVELLTYPDGEELTHDYDLGGRPTQLVSEAPQHDLYDQYGVAVPRSDVEIVYVDEVRYDQFGEATYLRTGTGVETRYEFGPTRRFLATIDTDSTAVTQYDGTVSTARPLQRLEYAYDDVGNIRDVVNRLYDAPTDTKVTDLGPPPVNNVPGPSQHAYTYDGHYRLTGAAATYVDQKELRKYTYESAYQANGNLASLKQVTTTTSTTGNPPKQGDSGNGKKGNGSGTSGTTTEPTCESNTGSGGGSFNQDPETTYVIAAADLGYDVDDAGTTNHQLIRAGKRTYTYDDNGNQTGWVHPCASSSGGTSTISRTFEWDAENRVTRIAEGNNDTDYRYSAEGARAMERGPGGTTWFVNEHWRTVNDGHRYSNVFLGGQMVASHRTSSADPAPPPCTDTDVTTCTCSSGTACRVVDVSQCDLATRVFDAGTSTCQPKEDRTIHFLHKDLQGSLRVATDEVATVFQYVDYLPNGRPWVAGQSTIKDTPYLFGGGWTDVTYKMVNFGDRWYEPREQSFISTEPLLEDNPYAAVTDPAVLSAYTYASSNPLRYVDPDGRASKTAYNGYDMGAKHENHQRGHITISVAKRDARKAPAITFGGRYSNDLNGQDLQKSFQDHKDKADRASTVLTINIEDGERKVYVFGNKVDDTSGGDQANPSPSPTSSGAASDSGPSQSAPQQPKSSTQPTADDSSSQGAPTSGQGGTTGAAAGGSGTAQPPPQASASNSGGGNDAPSTQQQPPQAPNAGSAAGTGPDPTS